MAKTLRFSRWRRLPGVYRTGDQSRAARPDDDPQRMTLYLPARLLDLAVALAREAGADSAQAYCEQLLARALEEEKSRKNLSEFEAKRGPLEGLDAIANDLDYLAEWTVSAQARPGNATLAEATAPMEQPESLALDAPAPARPVDIVYRHAMVLDEGSNGFLATLSRGEPINLDSARELLQALIDLERELQGASALDRGLAFVLHRLAFLGQLLVTEHWPGLGTDSATIETLRVVQEAVDRVISGDDIRYDRGEAS